MEDWRLIEEFPDYEVSDLGRIRNISTGRILSINPNQAGVYQVNIRRDGRTYNRAVNRLVAAAFHDGAPQNAVPMHIDGDKANLRANNLEWKPAWFASRFSRQANRTWPKDPRPVLMVSTGVIYPNALVCAKEIRGLEDLVLATARNRTGATYMGSHFRFTSI